MTNYLLRLGNRNEDCHLSSLLLSRVCFLRRSGGSWQIICITISFVDYIRIIRIIGIVRIISGLYQDYQNYQDYQDYQDYKDCQDYQDYQPWFLFTWAKAPGNTRARHRVATENIDIVNDMILFLRWYDIVNAVILLMLWYC